MFPALLIGAALGLGKQMLEKSQNNAQRKALAEANRYSAWTGKNFDMPAAPNLANNILQGAAMGGMMSGLGSAASAASGAGSAGLGGSEMAGELGKMGTDFTSEMAAQNPWMAGSLYANQAGMIPANPSAWLLAASGK